MGIWYYFTSLGVTPDTDKDLTIKIRLVNGIAILFSISIFLYTPLIIALVSAQMGSFLYLLLFGHLGTLVLNRARQYLAAKTVMLLTLNVGIFYLIILSPTLDIEMFFTTAVCLPFLIFDETQKK